MKLPFHTVLLMKRKYLVSYELVNNQPAYFLTKESPKKGFNEKRTDITFNI